MFANNKTPWSFTARRDLLINLVRKEIKIRYMGTSLGLVWSLFNPAITSLTYLVVFTYIFPSTQDRFALYLVTGIVHWNLFSQVISQGCDWLTGNGHLLRKMYFPRILAPVSGALTVLTFWLATLSVYALLYAPMGGRVSAALLAYPFVLALFLLFAFGIGLIFSVAQVSYRDIRHIVDALLPVIFWVTPIVWMSQSLPENIQQWLSWNPLAPFFRCFTAILHDAVLPHPADLFIVCIMGLTFALAGLSLFSSQADGVIEKI